MIRKIFDSFIILRTDNAEQIVRRKIHATLERICVVAPDQTTHEQTYSQQKNLPTETQFDELKIQRRQRENHRNKRHVPK